MNLVKLSGKLLSVEEHAAPSGKIVTAKLRRADGVEIVLVAAGNQLDSFDSGDDIIVAGRVVAYENSIRIMLDDVARWNRDVRRQEIRRRRSFHPCERQSQC